MNQYGRGEDIPDAIRMRISATGDLMLFLEDSLILI